MIQKSKSHKNLLTLTFVALLLMDPSNALSVARLRDTGDWADEYIYFSTGKGFDPGGSFENGSVIRVKQNKYRTATNMIVDREDTQIQAMSIECDNTQIPMLSAGANIKVVRLGSIVTPSKPEAATLRLLGAPPGYEKDEGTDITFILTGTDGAALGINSGLNNYSGLGDISPVITLRVDSLNRGEIEWRGNCYGNTEGNRIKKLEVFTDFINGNGTNFKEIDIGKRDQPAMLTLLYGVSDTYTSPTLNFNHEYSTLRLKNDNGKNRIINLYSRIMPNDNNYGVIELNAINDNTLLKLQARKARITLGTPTYRFKELWVTGNQPVYIEVPVFAKTVNITNKAAGVYLGKNISCDKWNIQPGSKIELINNITTTGDLSAENFVINLSNKKLNYQGETKFTDTLQINSQYNANTNKGGNIQITSGKFDLSGAELLINTSITSDITNLPEKIEYNLVAAINDAVIIPPTQGYKLTITDDNRLITWIGSMVLNNNTLTLTAASTIFKAPAPKTPSPPLLPPGPAEPSTLIGDNIRLSAHAGGSDSAGSFVDVSSSARPDSRDSAGSFVDVSSSARPDSRDSAGSFIDVGDNARPDSRDSAGSFVDVGGKARSDTGGSADSFVVVGGKARSDTADSAGSFVVVGGNIGGLVNTPLPPVPSPERAEQVTFTDDNPDDGSARPDSGDSTGSFVDIGDNARGSADSAEGAIPRGRAMGKVRRAARSGDAPNHSNAGGMQEELSSTGDNVSISDAASREEGAGGTNVGITSIVRASYLGDIGANSPNKSTSIPQNRANELISQELNQNAEQQKFAIQLSQVTNGVSDAARFKNSLGLFNKESATADRREAADRLIIRNIPPSTAMWESLKGMHQPADQRILELQTINHTVVSAGNGDEIKKITGFWFAPFAARATQKLHHESNGYKSNMLGGTLGADYSINDSFLFGVTYSYLNTNLKYQGIKIGDKAKVQTNIVSLYGVQSWTHNCFLEGVLSYGWSRVKTNEGRKTPNSMAHAIGKYTARAYSGQLVAGYNYFADNKVIITPIVGLRYVKFRDASYHESGTSYQNLNLKNKFYDKLEGLVGIRVATLIPTDQMLIIPELHGNINYNIKGKSPNIEARMDGIDEALPTKAFKQPKIFYNVGGGIMFKCHNQPIEYGIKYNATLAKRYIGHQGSIKIQVNL